MDGASPGDTQESDESVNSYREEIKWDEESDVDGDGGTESELDVDREVSDDDRDLLAKDGSGEEDVWSHYIVSGTHE